MLLVLDNLEHLLEAAGASLTSWGLAAVPVPGDQPGAAARRRRARIPGGAAGDDLCPACSSTGPRRAAGLGARLRTRAVVDEMCALVDGCRSASSWRRRASRFSRSTAIRDRLAATCRFPGPGHATCPSASGRSGRRGLEP